MSKEGNYRNAILKFRFTEKYSAPKLELNILIELDSKHPSPCAELKNLSNIILPLTKFISSVSGLPL